MGLFVRAPTQARGTAAVGLSVPVQPRQPCPKESHVSRDLVQDQKQLSRGLGQSKEAGQGEASCSPRAVQYQVETWGCPCTGVEGIGVSQQWTEGRQGLSQGPKPHPHLPPFCRSVPQTPVPWQPRGRPWLKTPGPSAGPLLLSLCYPGSFWQSKEAPWGRSQM